MFNIKRKSIVPVLLVVSLVFSGSAAYAQEQLTVRLDFIPWGVHGAMHLASQKGWFKEAGLDVTIQDGTGSANTIQLVAAGQVDVGQVQLGVMAIAKEHGAELISIAGWFRKSDLGVLVPRSSDIMTASDLAGHSIVNFNSSPWGPFIDSFLKKNGILGEVQIVAVAPSALMSTYTSGHADTVMTTAPFGLPVVEGVRPSRAILMADSGIAFPSYGLIVRPETLKTKTDALRKLVQVQARAWEYIYNGHIGEAVDAIIAQRPGMEFDRDVLRGQLERYRNFIYTKYSKGLSFGVQTDKDWAAVIESLIAADVISAGYEPSDFYTNKLLRP